MHAECESLQPQELVSIALAHLDVSYNVSEDNTFDLPYGSHPATKTIKSNGDDTSIFFQMQLFGVKSHLVNVYCSCE